LETCVNKCCGEGAIIAIENHVNGEGREGRLLVFGDLVGNDTTPEWIECSGTEDIAPTIDIENEIIEGELWKSLTFCAINKSFVISTFWESQKRSKIPALSEVAAAVRRAAAVPLDP